MEYGVYKDLLVTYPKPYSIYLRGTIDFGQYPKFPQQRVPMPPTNCLRVSSAPALPCISGSGLLGSMVGCDGLKADSRDKS